MDVKECLEELLKDCAKENRIFSSEADFQFALAWKIKEKYKCEIRLEYRPWQYDKKIELDIAILDNNSLSIPIELKYKTKALEDSCGNEEINLTDQGARNQARYDFLADIQRIDGLIKSKKYQINKGYAIFLTNDKNYWDTKYQENTTDEDFRIHEGATITNLKKWKDGTSEGTIGKSRKNPIDIQGNYPTIHWEKHFPVPNYEFRYTIVEIKK